MSDPSPHSPLYEYGFIAGVAAGLVAAGNWLWKKTRPDNAPFEVTITPALVRDAVIELRTLVTTLHADHELFLQEERSVHGQFVKAFDEVTKRLDRLDDRLTSFALEVARSPKSTKETI